MKTVDSGHLQKEMLLLNFWIVIIQWCGHHKQKSNYLLCTGVKGDILETDNTQTLENPLQKSSSGEVCAALRFYSLLGSWHLWQVALSLFCSLSCSLVHAISGPPTAPVLFALSSLAAGLATLFVLISTMFAKELTSGDGSPCVFSCEPERTRPSTVIL